MTGAWEWLTDLTLSQVARLRDEGKITDEMLEEAGLTEALAKLRASLEEQAQTDPAFRDGLRAALMRQAEDGAGDNAE